MGSRRASPHYRKRLPSLLPPAILFPLDVFNISNRSAKPKYTLFGLTVSEM
jgi:hypothetical protein